MFEGLSSEFSNVQHGKKRDENKRDHKGSEALKLFLKVFTIQRKQNPTFALLLHVFFAFSFSAIFIVYLFNQMADCYRLYRFIVRSCSEVSLLSLDSDDTCIEKNMSFTLIFLSVCDVQERVREEFN